MSDPPPPPADLAVDLQHWAQVLADAEREAERHPPGADRVRALLAAARASWHLDDFLGSVKFSLRCLADKDLDTPPALVVSALTQAAFALLELGATAQARPLAQRALALTRVDALFDQLPIALSCAAAIASVAGELERAEDCNAEALARARQATGIDPLQMALSNQLLSYVELLRRAAREGDAALIAHLRQRARPHIAQARQLKDDARLSPWRRLILQQSLGELLGLCGVQPEGEHILAESLAQAATLADPFLVQSLATALADQLATLGRYRDALTLIETHVHPDEPHRGRFRRRVQATQTAETCLRQLGFDDEADRMAGRAARDLREWETLRSEAIRGLPG
jgi:tetratricopeptide (TPR) repeat protein